MDGWTRQVSVDFLGNVAFWPTRPSPVRHKLAAVHVNRGCTVESGASRLGHSHLGRSH
jgi:hypothetical protein